MCVESHFSQDSNLPCYVSGSQTNIHMYYMYWSGVPDSDLVATSPRLTSLSLMFIRMAELRWTEWLVSKSRVVVVD